MGPDTNGSEQALDFKEENIRTTASALGTNIPWEPMPQFRSHSFDRAEFSSKPSLIDRKRPPEQKLKITAPRLKTRLASTDPGRRHRDVRDAHRPRGGFTLVRSRHLIDRQRRA
jgi:hypothetical protein